MFIELFYELLFSESEENKPECLMVDNLMEVGENYKKGSWGKDGYVDSENTCGKGRCSRYDECKDLYRYKGFDVSVIKCFYY